MKRKSDFTIEVFGLKEGKHDYQFPVDLKLFEQYEVDYLQDANCIAKVKLDKSSTMIRVDIEISGKVILICDRSLEPFDYDVKVNEKYFFKYGDRHEEISEEICLIPFNESEIDLQQLLYDFILLALPTRRIHPDYMDGVEDEDDTSAYFSTGNVIEEDEEEEDKPIDPRWEKLKKLK
ncbi:YceD family protein [Sediminitomix flava]|uniref:Uncharacterized metal-binding protein YceD (DUF177 family) n=1 Tax=Sediminitomix flava TaxID=379075 RepID=A0A315Z568_SEDFL|nr:DUF177 domain-containing protein [Sediminitomix flava]PWJ38608.1 uncharacterized metal-binding protein YceD (DUF177 family) [Sediminitomix flava]